MMPVRKLGKIGVYGPKTRALQRRISYEVFGLTWKVANVYMYLGDRNNETPSINDIHTRIFYEVPDRAYSDVAIQIPLGMEQHAEQKVDFSRFGLINPLQDETIFRVHIDDFEPLGRELVIGDVFELPFFMKNNERAFWEITDVDLISEYERFISIIHAVPLGESRKTREIDIDQSNFEEMESAILDLDQEVAADVPSDEISFEPDTIEEKEFDPRTDIQIDFLDDPNKEF